MGCNEGLCHCLRLWCGWMTGNNVRSEAGDTRSKSIKSMSHGLNNVMLKFTQIFTS